MKTRNIALFAASSMLAPLLFFSLRLTAQQAAPPLAKQMVPNNPAEHPAPEQPIPYSHKQHLAMPCDRRQGQAVYSEARSLCQISETNSVGARVYRPTGHCVDTSRALSREREMRIVPRRSAGNGRNVGSH